MHIIPKRFVNVLAKRAFFDAHCGVTSQWDGNRCRETDASVHLVFVKREGPAGAFVRIF